jgi:hypothetical protein
VLVLAVVLAVALAVAFVFASFFVFSVFTSSSPFVDGGWVLGVELEILSSKLDVFSVFPVFEREGVLLLDPIIESDLRCGGVGVLGSVEGLCFGAGGMV